MGLLVLGRREHSQRPVQAAVVVPVDPAGGGELDVGDGLVRPGVEDGGADALGLVQAVHALHQRVVVGVTNRPDRGSDPLEGEVFGEPDRGVLPRLPASLWWISWPGAAGRPSRSRCHSAIRNGVITISVDFEVAACQATIFWENTSRMNAT